MMNTIKIGLITALTIISSFGLFAQSINSAESKAAFTATNMRWMEVEGTFTGMSGDINFDESNLDGSSFNVCLDANSVNTENQKRDDHLRNEDFFHVEKYPQICYTSSSITSTSKGFRTTGSLEMHGVSKDVTIDFTHSGGTFVGDLKIKRYDYGVGADTGTFMVGDEIVIKITAVTN